MTYTLQLSLSDHERVYITGSYVPGILARNRTGRSIRESDTRKHVYSRHTFKWDVPQRHPVYTAISEANPCLSESMKQDCTLYSTLRYRSRARFEDRPFFKKPVAGLNGCIFLCRAENLPSKREQHPRCALSLSRGHGVHSRQRIPVEALEIYYPGGTFPPPYFAFQPQREPSWRRGEPAAAQRRRTTDEARLYR